MNTGVVKKTNTLSLPVLPVLLPNKINAIVTKHLTNCVLYLPTHLAAMLIWMVYQCRADNTFFYNTSLLRRYCKSVYEANMEYNKKFHRRMHPGLKASVTGARRSVSALLEMGYLLRVSGDKLMINPLLTYYEYISRKEYKVIMERYQELVPGDELTAFCVDYVNLVNKKING